MSEKEYNHEEQSALTQWFQSHFNRLNSSSTESSASKKRKESSLAHFLVSKATQLTALELKKNTELTNQGWDNAKYRTLLSTLQTQAKVLAGNFNVETLPKCRILYNVF